MNTQFDSIDIGLGTVLFYEEMEGEYRIIWVYELNEGRFTEENIGDMVQLEVSPFYTRLLVENKGDFLLDGEDFYLYEIKMAEDKVLQPITGTENALYFSILPSDSSKVFISVVKYNEDMTYDTISDRLEVEIL